MFSQFNLKRTFTIALGLIATVAAGPCDILDSGNTSCVAAHSTTRALYRSYSGELYQVQRGSDGATTTITPRFPGGVADAAAQDSFCYKTTCLITVIYDQSGHGNHLTQAPPGGWAGPDVGGYDNLASAIGAPVTLNGQKAYGVFVSPGTGYRNDATTGVATDDEPEGIYAVFDGTHYNDECCFDYGNAEVSNTDTGAGHMEALYFGNCTFWGWGSGSGPWIMADLENGLFSGYNAGYNPGDPSIYYRFVTAVTKSYPDHWSLRGGNSQGGSLSTFYSGVRPAGYEIMYKEGAIILGIGGDNSNSAQGTFYEGVMTTGYPSDAVDAMVQANIVAAGYAVTSLTSGPPITVGSTISLRATTPGYMNRYLAHNGTIVTLQTVNSSITFKEEASWNVVTGLGNSLCISLESVDTPGSYIRHYDFELYVEPDDGTKQFHEDATFCPEVAFNNVGTNSIRAWGYPTRWIRHYDLLGYIASNGGVQDFDTTVSFTNDASWVVTRGLA